MAAPVADAGEFESWLNDRLDSLEVDREVYGAYILGVLQEEETDEEKEDALQGILSAFLVIKTQRHVPLCHQGGGGLTALSRWLSSEHGRHEAGVLMIALCLYGKYGYQNLNEECLLTSVVVRNISEDFQSFWCGCVV